MRKRDSRGRRALSTTGQKDARSDATRPLEFRESARSGRGKWGGNIFKTRATPRRGFLERWNVESSCQMNRTLTTRPNVCDLGLREIRRTANPFYENYRDTLVIPRANKVTIVYEVINWSRTRRSKNSAPTRVEVNL